jgi:hypothetical protein
VESILSESMRRVKFGSVQSLAFKSLTNFVQCEAASLTVQTIYVRVSFAMTHRGALVICVHVRDVQDASIQH